MFLAFAYFLVGQAASTRNGAQTAADAAALAAAQDVREQLWHGWIGVILEPGQWDKFLQGRVRSDTSAACQQAEEFAARNKAVLWDGGCVPLATGEHGFKVTVRTTGQKPKDATASAEAVLESRCTFGGPLPPSDSPGPSPGATPTSPGEDDEEPDDEGPIVGLICDGEPWEIDPHSPTLPDAADLFRVRLSD
ncbi:pilus assembly protein TadG-related protein [Streptomyces litmocidini]|uniref:pilus assembly protein TadG-related protein n=1 Tax=Streptomyces litmocidini TaxID=67318 RepID=UPI004032F4EC